MTTSRPLLITALVLALFAGSLTTACGGAPADAGHGLAMAPMSQMPADVQAAPVRVQQAYQFAAANPEVMQQIPCYCGCGAMGHTSNYDCYVSGSSGDDLSFDTHALGCSICVDITQDTMRLLKQGKTIPQIRAYVDNTYGRYGPSNMP
ncbi:MAG: hypothetical protein HY784_16825 [Chloroflexi bacterium]|nr:hypothetical protein [Chloroflexota bacterium]